jgi:hypothetical protein
MDAFLSFDALFILITAIIIPIGLARWMAVTTWLQIASACIIWAMVLWSMIAGLPANQQPAEVVAYAAIFYGWAAVPVIALVFRLNHLPERFIALLQARR